MSCAAAKEVRRRTEASVRGFTRASVSGVSPAPSDLRKVLKGLGLALDIDGKFLILKRRAGKVLIRNEKEPGTDDAASLEG